MEHRPGQRAALQDREPEQRQGPGHQRLRSPEGTTLQQYSFAGGNNQLWYFEPTSGGYVIRNFESRQALEVGGNSTADGAAIDQWMALNQPNQAWTIQ